MNNRFLYYMQFFLAIMDVLVIVGTFSVAESLFRQHETLREYKEYNTLRIFLSAAWLIIAMIDNIYGRKYILSFEAFVKKTIRGYFYFLSVAIVYLFFFQQYAISRAFLLVVFSSIPVLLLANRFLLYAISLFYRKKEYLIDRILIIGYNDMSKKLIQSLEENPMNKEIIGICDDPQNVKEHSHYPILSSIPDAMEVCKKYGANEVYSSIAPEQNPEIYNLIHQADKHCIKFRILPDVSYFVNKEVHITYMNDLPVLAFRNEPLEEMTNRIKKRMFDIVVSSIAIVFVLSWLVPLIGILIYLESPGPIFFRQIRTGKGNKSFNCLKFRSMKINSESNNKQAVRNDSRLTRIGKFIRKTNIDEMPQFINVLLGQMSVIGPRPHPVTFFSMLRPKDDVNHLQDNYSVRHFVKPGVSGWAQVNGFRGEIEMSEQLQKRIEYDIWYSENWTLLLDIRIMILTVVNTFRGEKNAF